ncbi:uncharacterized protein [Mycetomoellerius zeteki]|uniref:uncharacterized protein isoform X2 n=1 Tax=Mycetomoellerius zeteki TaxID=64791 RepID=UPI00084E97F8|nr:PREDICTED: uncharacterized protein LOC108723465 isoform X2 [Trachymyrmex zeteki]
MTSTTGLTVAHTMNPILKYFFDCMSLNFMNGNFNLVFQGINCLWMISVTFIFNGTPQKIIQWSQVTASRRPIDISISADYSIFENTAQKIDCNVGCVARSAILLKPNVICVIIFNFAVRTVGARERVVLSNNDPVSRTRFTN